MSGKFLFSLTFHKVLLVNKCTTFSPVILRSVVIMLVNLMTVIAHYMVTWTQMCDPGEKLLNSLTHSLTHCMVQVTCELHLMILNSSLKLIFFLTDAV